MNYNHGSSDSLRLNLSVSDNQPVTDIPKINSSGKKFKEFVGLESEFEDTRSRNSLSRQHGNTQSESTVKIQTQKGHGNLNSSRMSNQAANAERGPKNLISGQLVNDIQRSPFARTRSSPELTVTYRNRRKNVDAELLNHTGQSSGDDLSSIWHAPTHIGFDASVDSNNGSSLYQRDPGLHSMNEEIYSNVGA
ncbi:hypothetical protein L6452_41931 [Arctium lappa]|uniref:Uncharacterized protein n=1 Tax=Arctium lappa TaxID=4217 RepID=A0ACB8XI15_ARCLA|nr:hypothetical protein L6452_41931 [Arctium lappa]